MNKQLIFAAVIAATSTSAFSQGVETPSTRYRVTFEPNWSATNHPVDYPSDAHFSPFIGSTHTSNIELWRPGDIASIGTKEVAEIGNPILFNREIINSIRSGEGGELIESDGFFLPGNSTTTFVAQQDFPEFTLISMIAPSPDWFIGVHNLPLIQNGAWVENLAIDLFPYDAGTDSGVTYNSADQPTIPAEPIQLLSGFPVANNNGAVAPFGTLTLERITDAFCDIEFTQETYQIGESVDISSWIIANPGTADVPVELKVWLHFPKIETEFLISNEGADGSFILPAGYSENFGSFPLFTLDSGFQPGTYELNCRVSNPITGETLSYDRNVIEVLPSF